MTEQQNTAFGLISKSAVKLSLGVSDSTLTRWAKNGTLTRVRVGRKIFYRVTDLAKLMGGGEVWPQ